MSDKLDRNLAIELVRVTEAAALSAARFMGLGECITGAPSASLEFCTKAKRPRIAVFGYFQGIFGSVPGRIRTRGLLIRSQTSGEIITVHKLLFLHYLFILFLNRVF